jgi:hypothetical protein
MPNDDDSPDDPNPPPALSPEDTDDPEDEDETDIDPCPCCPDCNQEECECAECGDNNDCECKMPGGFAPPALTYDIVIYTNYLCPYHDDSSNCGFQTNGTASVTMNFIDSETGYWGSSSDGIGETIKAGYCDAKKASKVLGDLRSYEFTAQLSIFGDQKAILVGVDRLGSEWFYFNWGVWGEGLVDMESGSIIAFFFQFMMENPVPPENGLVVYPDLETGLLIFEVPLIEGEYMQGQQFMWKGEADLFITITLTPLP